MSPHPPAVDVDKRLLLLASALVAVALAGATVWYAVRAPPSTTGGQPDHRLVFGDPSLGGNPQENTSAIWVAVIANVSSEEPFSAYEAGLFRDGEALVPPVVLHPGVLGTSGNLWFEFFDYGTLCYPNPCPPPEGPDGLLNRHDYFRLSQVESGAAYVVRVFWAGSGDLAGEIEVRT